MRRINATAKETPRTRKGDEVKGPKRSDDEPVAAERNTKGTQENSGHGCSQKKRRRKEEKKINSKTSHVKKLKVCSLLMTMCVMCAKIRMVACQENTAMTTGCSAIAAVKVSQDLC